MKSKLSRIYLLGKMYILFIEISKFREFSLRETQLLDKILKEVFPKQGWHKFTQDKLKGKNRHI